MALNSSYSSTQSPIYQKAQEIFSLSRNISEYVLQDLSNLNQDGSEDLHVYFSGDIVQQSVSLAPEILKAEQKLFSEDKYKHVASVTRLTNLLYKNCERLERANTNGKDFLPILRKELKKFRKLQRNWMLTL
ncbi:hypothetical protein [Cochleicola gelatinilyticus]|uniref:Four helix bundle protein n=1 Tax=Cochleicola gelatinilyticus TaxID=1763537 RepID=A0A167ERE7_9FLAO|nr:hypothetical protein [Cochleicola gelatinilyticus]OAB75804.1 hypothetical protein ULVI_15115 [Cochleicola gelatinilyticus]